MSMDSTLPDSRPRAVLARGLSLLSGPLWLPLALDTAANALDYVFHLGLGRALPAPELAMFQALNGVLLVLITMCSIFQPAVARFVAEARALGQPPARMQAIFRQAASYAAVTGVALTFVLWAVHARLADWLRLAPGAVAISSVVALFALLRPVVVGMLQGQERFVAVAGTRVLQAASRLVLGLALVRLGGGMLGAVAAVPASLVVAIGAGLALAGSGALGALRSPATPPLVKPSEVWRMCAAGLVAYGAYMALLNADLVWANRSLPGELAGQYAAAAILRRILAVLPGTVVLIMYPRAVARVALRQLPDRLVAATVVAVLGAGLALSAAYFVLGGPLLALAFGPAYAGAGTLVGWMGLGTVGYTLALIWLNLFLAVDPWPYAGVLMAVSLLQAGLLARSHGSAGQMVAVFGACGWGLGLAGAALYGLLLRPGLLRRWAEAAPEVGA
jgi:O-antigen/teichoic acid export membrane protein